MSDLSPPRPRPRRGRPPASDAAATRTRLLLGARACFADKGYLGTSNRDIAAAVGVTSGTIYVYFASKAELYLAVLGDAFEAILPRFQGSIRPEMGAVEAVTAVLRTGVEIHGKDPSLAAFLVLVPIEMKRVPEIGEGAPAFTEAFISLVTDWVAQGQSLGELPPEVDPQAVVEMFLACFMGMVQYAAVSDGGDLEAPVEAFLQLLRGRLLG
jgi:AcrR family transcriptional regulator